MKRLKRAPSGGSSSDPLARRHRAENWNPLTSPTSAGQQRVDETLALIKQQELPIYHKLLVHWEVHKCISFYEAVKSAIAAKEEMDHLASSVVTFIKNVETAHLNSGNYIPPKDRAELNRLTRAYELKASKQRRSQKSLLDDNVISIAIEEVLDQDSKDLLRFITTTGFRAEDTTQMLNTDVLVKQDFVRVEATITKIRKRPADRVVLTLPRSQLFEGKLFEEMIARRQKLAQKNEEQQQSLFSRTNKRGLVVPTDVTRLQTVLNAIEGSVLEKVGTTRTEHLTSQTFRLRYIAEQISFFRDHNGIINWEGVRQRTLHFDSKTLQAAYDRLDILPKGDLS